MSSLDDATRGTLRQPLLPHAPPPPAPAPPPPAVDCGVRFLRRSARLLRGCAASSPVLLLLVALSLADAYCVSLVGAVASAFYQIFLDAQPGRLAGVAARAGALYAAAAALGSAKKAAAELLEWRWRGGLAARLQALYCARGAQGALEGVDNPEQRLSSDVRQLAAAAASVCAGAAAAPFNVLWYSWCAYGAFGGAWPVAAAAAFFVAGALLQRTVSEPVARLVYAQEAAEGDYRYALARHRSLAAEVELCRGGAAELAHLRQRLAAALRVQCALVLRRWALTAATQVIDYAGALVNYGCLAVAVFGGVWGGGGAGETPGDLAARVSLASFYLLTLVWSFTQVLDLARDISSLAGLTARVAQLMEALSPLSAATDTLPRTSSSASGRAPAGVCTDAVAAGPPSLAAGLQEAEGRELHGVGWGQGAGGSVQRYASQAQALLAPHPMITPEGDLLEVSVHSLGSDLLHKHVAGVFPDAPPGAPLLAVVTFQFCAHEDLLGSFPPAAAPDEDAAPNAGVRAWLDDAAAAPPPPPPPGGASGGLRRDQRTSSGGAAFASAAPASTAPRADAAVFLAPSPPPEGGRLLPSRRESSDSACSGSSSRTSGGLSIASHQHFPGTPEMDRMLNVFLCWQDHVRAQLSARGFWCDAVNPCTGYALHGARGLQYSEIIGAEVLLGYVSAPPMPPPPPPSLPGGPSQLLAPQQQQQQQQQPEADTAAHDLITHPAAGTHVYPATLFTNAPAAALQAALAAVAAPDPHPPAPAPSLASRPPPPPVLVLRRLTVRAPNGAHVVRDLSLQVPRQGGLLVTGPSGAGKTTLVRCLAGLAAAEGGLASMPPPARVMFVPQRPMLGPGATLRQQLAYPREGCAAPSNAGVGDGSSGGACRGKECTCCDAHCAALLEAVGLAHLAAQVACGLDGAVAWEAVLSPGEVQRLALARVLHHRPALAVLDEATSSVTPEAEAAAYAALQAAGVTCVSVGHRASLRALHPTRLHISGDGSGRWMLAASHPRR